MTIPEKLGRYEIISELGKGAMGIVSLGRDPLIGRQLALKTFRLGYSAGDQELEQFRERFLREAQSAGILSHPNIVTIHDVAVDPGGDFFIAMEYVQGTDLKLVMQRQGRFDPKFAVEVVAQIADGLGYAHSKKVVHRDIKPANIIITQDKQAKITDFGIARVEASNLTVEGQLLGTPNYMAPEQIQGKPVDHRADIFSLGVMFYELLTGEKPFAAPNLTAVTHRIVFEPYPPLEQTAPGLPAAFTQVLDRALAKDPEQRYDRGADMAADLRAIFSEASTGTQATQRSGSFLDGVPATAQTPPDATSPTATSPTFSASTATAPAVPAVGVSSAGVPVSADGGTVVSNVAAGGTLVTGAATAPSAAPTGAFEAPATVQPPPAAAPAAIPRPAAQPPAAEVSDSGMPVAGRIAAILGVVIALAVVGFGIFKLAMDDAEAPRAADAELDPQQQVLALLQEGRELLDGGQPGAALEVLESALAMAPENREVRRLRDQAQNQAEPSVDDPQAFVSRRLAAAQEAMRERDYEAAIRLAQEALAVEPEQKEIVTLLADAREGQQRREEIRARLRTPPQTPPSRPASGSSSSGRAAAPPANTSPKSVAPSASAILALEFRSEVSEGRLTIFNGQQKIYQEPFKFVTGKSGVFSRQRGTSGSFSGQLTLPSGDLDLKIYVRPTDSQTRSVEVTGNLPPGGTRALKIEVSDEGRISATLE